MVRALRDMLASLAVASLLFTGLLMFVVVSGVVAGAVVPYDLHVQLLRWLAVGSAALLGTLVSARVSLDTI